MSVVGFDFGNLNSYVAVARQGGIEIVTNDYSLRATPSYVALDSKSRIMGVSAKQKQMTNIKSTVFSFKNLIGRKFKDPVVQEEMGRVPYKLSELPDGSVGIEVEYLDQKRVFIPEQIMAMMLHKLKETAEAYLTAKVVDCVISVPSFWTDAQRRAMLHAAEIAQLNVLRLVNETAAVALNYGIYKQDLPALEEKDAKMRQVCFVDIGHSATQISICKLQKGKLVMVGSGYDLTIGGRAFDLALCEHFAEEFSQRYKVDARKSPRAWFRLLDECAKLKMQMSANANDMFINIECFMEDKDVSGKMCRADFEVLIKPITDKLEGVIRNILKESKVDQKAVDAVEIVGGSTRIPVVKRIISGIFGKDPSTTLNQDEAVAKGCALQCAILSPAFRVREFSVTDVQPYSIKVSWAGEANVDGGELEVFPELHPFPFSKMLTFYRKEPFVLDAFYALPNHIPYPNTHIGKFTVQKVTPDQEGESSKVKVKVRINPNGIFSISSASMYEKYVVDDDKPEENMETDENGGEGKQDGLTNEGSGAPESNTQASEEGEKMDVQENGPATGEPTKSHGKEKVKVKSIDLPIEPYIPSQWSQADITKFQSMEIEMVCKDQAEKAKVDAKNALEEYVYELRDKLCDQLQPYVSSGDAEQFKKALEKTEDWLYDEGEDQEKKVYDSRLEELRKWGDPIVERYMEAQGRPGAFEELGRVLQRTRKALDAYFAKDPTYDHWDKSDVEKLQKAVEKHHKWLNEQIRSQDKRPLTDPPVVRVSEIQSERSLLEAVANPILNKPKPKVEPPPEEKKGSEGKSKKGSSPKKGGEAPKENGNDAAGQETPQQSMDTTA